MITIRAHVTHVLVGLLAALFQTAGAAPYLKVKTDCESSGSYSFGKLKNGEGNYDDQTLPVGCDYLYESNEGSDIERSDKKGRTFTYWAFTIDTLDYNTASYLTLSIYNGTEDGSSAPCDAENLVSEHSFDFETGCAFFATPIGATGLYAATCMDISNVDDFIVGESMGDFTVFYLTDPLDIPECFGAPTVTPTQAPTQTPPTKSPTNSLGETKEQKKKKDSKNDEIRLMLAASFAAAAAAAAAALAARKAIAASVKNLCNNANQKKNEMEAKKQEIERENERIRKLNEETARENERIRKRQEAKGSAQALDVVKDQLDYQSNKWRNEGELKEKREEQSRKKEQR